MCFTHPSEPIAHPLLVHQLSEQERLLYYTLLLGKVTELRNGVHQTKIRYPIRNWVLDPNYNPDNHDAAIHMATLEAIRQNKLNAFGSHPLVMAVSNQLQRGNHGVEGSCWRDHQVLPTVCLTCEGIEKQPEVLNLPEFWRDLGLLPAGSIAAPNGEELLLPETLNRLYVKASRFTGAYSPN